MRFSTKYWAGLLLLTLGLAWIFLSPRFSPLSQSAPPDSSRLFELGDHWQHEIELTHAADRYDCIESASKQLACTLVRHLQATSLLDQEPPSISLRCDDQQLPTDVRARLFSSLQSHLQQALLEIGHTRTVQLNANSTTTSDQAESAEPKLEIRLTAPSED